MKISKIARVNVVAATTATVALLMTGCFPQSQNQALNCNEMRSLWAKSQREIRSVLTDASGDPGQKAQRIGVIAGELKREADGLSDPELSEAMKSVATNLETMSKAMVDPGNGTPPLPPAQDMAKLAQVMDRKCPV